MTLFLNCCIEILCARLYFQLDHNPILTNSYAPPRRERIKPGRWFPSALTSKKLLGFRQCSTSIGSHIRLSFFFWRKFTSRSVIRSNYLDLLFFFFFFHLTYSRWTSSLPSCLWSQRIFPSLPGSRLTFFLSRCKFSTLTTRQPMVEFYLLTFPRFPIRKKEHKSYLGKNGTHDFRTSRCAGYLLDHSGDERLTEKQKTKNNNNSIRTK